jgi:uncharacterized protein
MSGIWWKGEGNFFYYSSSMAGAMRKAEKRMTTTSQILEDLTRETRSRFEDFNDPAHGWEHVQRVYHTALYIAEQEGADPFITGAAALLHDIGRLVRQKGTPHAELSLVEARPLLERYELGLEQIEAILHAILAHSYSRGVEPRTLEAFVVRDADRLDGLGAVGILRWAITGTIKRKAITRSYHPDDPFADWHELDDKRYMLDHFYTKLLKLEETMSTPTGRTLAKRRSEYMRDYLREFKLELELTQPSVR